MRYKTVGEIFEVVTDYVANGSFKSLKDNVNYVENGYAALIRLVDYRNNFKNSLQYIDKESYDFLSKTKLYGGEIVISNVGANAGTIFRVPKLGIPMSLGPNTITINTSEKITNDYYYYYFQSHNGQNLIHSIISGSAQPKFNKTDFKNLSVPYPSVKEQKETVDILNALDKKIELNSKINTNLLELLNTQYKHFLSKYNLTKVKLGDLCDVSAGGDKPKKISKEKNNENTIPVYSNGAKNNGLYGYTNEAKIFKKAVTVSARGTIGYTVLRTEPFVPIVRLISLQSKGTISPEFLYLLVNNLPIQGYGSTQQQITVPYVKKIVVSIPSSDLIIKFQKEIGPLFNQIDKNKRENDQLTSIKNVLLNKLF